MHFRTVAGTIYAVLARRLYETTDRPRNDVGHGPIGSTDDGLLWRLLLAFNFSSFSLHPFRVQTGLCEPDLSSPEPHQASAWLQLAVLWDREQQRWRRKNRAGCQRFQVRRRRTALFIGMDAMRRCGIHIETST